LRAALLPRLKEISHRFHVKVQGHAPIHAVANDDLDPADDRPSAVHFLRFDLPLPVRRAILGGSAVLLGCDHPDYSTCTAMHVARYKLPKAFVFRPSIQRSPSGKADYRWAKEQALAGGSSESTT
jgi:acyl-CoA synthetase (AMP-forming)/AMP-acid ligase II